MLRIGVLLFRVILKVAEELAMNSAAAENVAFMETITSSDAANNARNSLASMSVSAPNLSAAAATNETVNNLLETFANLTRARNLGNNVNLSQVGTSHTVSDIVRLALSADFGGMYVCIHKIIVYCCDLLSFQNI